MGDKQINKDVKCPICNSKQIYSRIKTKEYVCKTCGNSWSKK